MANQKSKIIYTLTDEAPFAHAVWVFSGEVLHSKRGAAV